MYFRDRRIFTIPGQREQAQEAVHLPGKPALGKAAQWPHHLQVFGAGEVRIQVRLFGHVAQALLVGDGIAADGLAPAAIPG